MHSLKKHIVKHHKKYLTGGLGGYLIAHLFIIKAFFFKMLFLKIIVLLLAALGIYDEYKTFAEIQPICVNGEGLVPLSKCEIDFATIKEAITYLEKKLDIAHNTIYSDTDYHMLQQTLHNHCATEEIKEADVQIKETIQQITSSLPQKEYEKLVAINDLFEKYKSESLGYPDFDNYFICAQKYKDYTLLGKLRSDFIKILDKKNLLSAASSKSAFDMVSRKDDGIINSALDKNINEAKQKFQKDDAINLHSEIPSFPSNIYSEKITKKIIELSEIQVNTTVQELIKEGVLTVLDKERLQDKIKIRYILGCDKAKGSYTIQQSINSKNEIVGTVLQNITLNVNVCFVYEYIQNLRTYLQKITLHELGHYVYYFKDGNAKAFERICRNNNKISCAKNEFISEYAKSGPEEDYAESFMHRYLKDAVGSSTNLAAKLNYFSGIF